ncbi:MAG: hypothetical protein P8J59_01585 [Phycisphaerales bacterium]|jgi:protein tyrosine phosphatase (PTP) superfamily phosphohydrolase (DUF442 family)|nr:hypothetical protein [Phycisphaerales bacterium]
MTTLVFAILLFLNAFVVPPTGAARDFEVRRVQLGDLRLVHQVGPVFFTGGSPRGDADFESLRAAGIQTVISVDGAKPEVEPARLRGIRYVHLPIGYDGVESSVAVRLARAIRDLPGPIYLHCHHGRHRAPAAAAVGLASLGRLEPSRGIRMLEIVGTSRDYPGLYSAVGGSAPLSKTAIDAIPLGDLPSVATVSDVATGMADVDRIHDRLRLLAANDWVTPARHADLVPAVEAGILTERFRGMSHLAPNTGSAGTPAGPPPDFRRAIDLASSLEMAVGEGRVSEADAILGAISSECRACHRLHRNGPRPGRE